MKSTLGILPSPNIHGTGYGLAANLNYDPRDRRAFVPCDGITIASQDYDGLYQLATVTACGSISTVLYLAVSDQFFSESIFETPTQIADNPINGTDPTGLWKQVGSNSDDRATWESQGTDKIADLADKVKLSDNIDEIHHWLQGGSIHFQYRKDNATPSTLSKNDRFAPLCPGQKFTVPNVWIAGNLLQGGNLYSQVVNIGGVVGMLGTDLGVQKKVVKVTTFTDLVNAVNNNSGNIWGIVIFGHGGQNGYLGDHDAKNFGSEGQVINSLAGQGFRVAQSWAMQCYSFFQGTYNGSTYDWKKQWESVSLDAHGYQGVNALGIDTKQ